MSGVMLVSQLDEGEVPYIGLPDEEAADKMAASIAEMLGYVVHEEGHPNHEDVLELAQRYCKGQGALVVRLDVVDLEDVPRANGDGTGASE